MPVAGSWSKPGRGGAQADIVLTAPQDKVPLLTVEVDNCHETAEELADKVEKYARFFRRQVKDPAGKEQPMWRTCWTTPPGTRDDSYPPVLLVSNPLGARNPERTIPRPADLTRHLWTGDKDYDEESTGFVHFKGLWSTSCGAVTFGHTTGTRLRRNSNSARPSIWRSGGILLRSTCPRHGVRVCVWSAGTTSRHGAFCLELTERDKS